MRPLVLLLGLALGLGSVSGAEAQLAEPALVASRDELAVVARQRARRSEVTLRRIAGRARRSRTLEVEVADSRALFDLTLFAATELAFLDIVPADANHELRRWDTRFRAAMRTPWYHPPARLELRACERQEIEVLLAAQSLSTIRISVYSGDRRDELLLELVRRRVLADEAERRRTQDLSCEDLPSVFDTDLAIPELERVDLARASMAERALWRLTAFNVGLFGRAAIEALREHRRAEPERFFTELLSGITETGIENAGTIRPARVPRCGEIVELSEADASRWTALGMRARPRFFAYGVEAEGGVLVVSASADTDCDGNVERFESRIQRDRNGSLMRTVTREI